jgi:PilZ domain
MEQRKYSRYEVQQDAYLIIKDKNIACNVQNISCAGAYMKVDERFTHDVQKNDIGVDVVIIFNTGKQSIQGKILRYMYEENSLFLAIYFLQNYYFE